MLLKLIAGPIISFFLVPLAGVERPEEKFPVFLCGMILVYFFEFIFPIIWRAHENNR